MSFIFIDYLKAKGYKYESTILMLEEMYNYNAFLNIGIQVLKLALVFDKLGSVSEENYELLFDDNEYEELLDFYIKNILEGSHKLMINSFLYNCGYPLAIYMFMMYKNNSSFIQKIEELNSKLNSEDSLNELLRIVNINGYNDESIEKLIDAIFELKWNLTNDIKCLNFDDNSKSLS